MIPEATVEAAVWNGMTRKRLDMASKALGCDPEDVTDEERDALSEYIKLGGNVWAL